MMQEQALGIVQNDDLDMTRTNEQIKWMIQMEVKVCDVIVDNGSCENFVSKSMGNALQLPTSKYSHPYRLSWVRKGVKSKVTDTCKVPLSIGKVYAEEVHCDTIDMDTQEMSKS